jgi:hypothetical protein
LILINLRSCYVSEESRFAPSDGADAPTEYI